MDFFGDKCVQPEPQLWSNQIWERKTAQEKFWHWNVLVNWWIIATATGQMDSDSKELKLAIFEKLE